MLFLFEVMIEYEARQVLNVLILMLYQPNYEGRKTDQNFWPFLQQAFHKSLATDMIENLLTVLIQDKIGKTLHAEKIREVYHRNITEQKGCLKCSGVTKA